MNTIAQAAVDQPATMWTAVLSLIGLASMIAIQLLAMKKAKQDREQDRLDKLQEAELTKKYREGLKQDVQQAKDLTVATMRKAEEAIHTSNGIKESLQTHGVKLVKDPEQL